MNAAALHDFLRTRHSVRRFTPDAIPRPIIDRILETGTLAPSAHNRQPWRFVVLTDGAAKTSLAEAMGAEFRRDLLADGLSSTEAEKLVARSYQRTTEAPVVIILCLSMSEMDIYPDRTRSRNEYRMAAQSVALAGGQILLAAHAEGLGGVWVCAPLFAQATVRTALTLPADWEAQGMLLIGKQAGESKVRARKSLEDITIYR